MVRPIITSHAMVQHLRMRRRASPTYGGSCGRVGNAHVIICGESYRFVGEGAMTAMRKGKLLLVGLVFAAAAVFAVGVRGDAAEEVKRLAELMGWKAGTVASDIGAGDGKYTFAAVERVGVSGKVYATEIDAKKLEELRSEVAKRKQGNVIVVESKEAETNLPAACCDAIFLRRVYHHLTKPAEFDASLARSLKSGGRLAIMDFAPRSGLEPVG